MRNLILFEEYGASGGNVRFTEDQIAELLEGFNGSEYFQLNLESTKIDFKGYPVKLETEDYKNGVQGRAEVYLYDTYYKTDPKFIDAVKSALNVSSARDEDIESLMKDLDDVGYSEKKTASWEDIQNYLEREIKRGSFSFLEIDYPYLEIEHEVEQEGMDFIFKLHIAGYTGDIQFDTQFFIDDMLSELFYSKK